MSRISQTIGRRQAEGKKVLVPYVVAGDPDIHVTVQIMHALVAKGADIIELGIPFSDPSSDGPVIQLGAERALKAGTRLVDVFAIVRSFREVNQDTPVVLMGYLNPLESIGYEAFAAHAAEAGVDGLLIVDMPAYESEAFLAAVRPRGLDTIFLVAPTTSDNRLASIIAHTTGYLYYVSLKGVTGAAITDKQDIRAKIVHLRSLTSLPIVVGFGIKDASSACEMAAISDGVIVGSALVDKIAGLSGSASRTSEAITHSVQLIGDIRLALDTQK